MVVSFHLARAFVLGRLTSCESSTPDRPSIVTERMESRLYWVAVVGGRCCDQVAVRLTDGRSKKREQTGEWGKPDNISPTSS